MGKSKLDGTSVIEDYLGGLSADQLAERYGMSDVAVRNYLKKKRVEMRKSNDPVYDINRASPYTFNISIVYGELMDIQTSIFSKLGEV